MPDTPEKSETAADQSPEGTLSKVLRTLEDLIAEQRKNPDPNDKDTVWTDPDEDELPLLTGDDAIPILEDIVADSEEIAPQTPILLTEAPEPESANHAVQENPNIDIEALHRYLLEYLDAEIDKMVQPAIEQMAEQLKQALLTELKTRLATIIPEAITKARHVNDNE